MPPVSDAGVRIEDLAREAEALWRISGGDTERVAALTAPLDRHALESPGLPVPPETVRRFRLSVAALLRANYPCEGHTIDDFLHDRDMILDAKNGSADPVREERVRMTIRDLVEKHGLLDVALDPDDAFILKEQLVHLLTA